VTILEFLVVLAIIGIVGALGFLNGRRIADGQSAQAAVATVQQSIWQGATAAASRGREMRLIYDAQENALTLEDVDGNVERTFELPDGASTNIAAGSSDGLALRFLPPGKVAMSTSDPPAAGSLQALPGDLHIATGEDTYPLDVSIIGEVIAGAAQ
jgi:Tfp pilus assembly protein FimT